MKRAKVKRSKGRRQVGLWKCGFSFLLQVSSVVTRWGLRAGVCYDHCRLFDLKFVLGAGGLGNICFATVAVRALFMVGRRQDPLCRDVVRLSACLVAPAALGVVWLKAPLCESISAALVLGKEYVAMLPRSGVRFLYRQTACRSRVTEKYVDIA